MADRLAEMKLFSNISSAKNAMICRKEFSKFVQKFILINKHDVIYYRDYNYVAFVFQRSGTLSISSA